MWLRNFDIILWLNCKLLWLNCKLLWLNWKLLWLNCKLLWLQIINISLIMTQPANYNNNHDYSSLCLTLKVWTALFYQCLIYEQKYRNTTWTKHAINVTEQIWRCIKHIKLKFLLLFQRTPTNDRINKITGSLPEQNMQ